MFKKTKLKMRYTIMGFLILFILIVLLFSIISIHNELLRNYENGINDSIDLSINNCKANISTAIASTKKIVDLEDPITEQTLNNLKQVAFCIIGISYYPLTGEVIHSSGISGLPSLDDFKQIDFINDFFLNNTETSIYSLRTNTIATYYSATYYDNSYGIISYINKIYHNDILQGYLFVDISPYFLYRTFFDYIDYSYFKNYASFIIFSNNEYFHYQNNDRYEKYLSEIVPEKIVDSSDHQCFIVTREIKAINTYLTVVISKDYYYQSFFQTIMPLIILAIIFISISILISFFISRRTVNSLISLNQKMSNASNIIKDEVEHHL